MSSSSAQDISDLQSGIVMGYVSIACAVFPIYDYILTTGTEVTVFWSQPQKTFRGSSLLLILIRLTTLGTAITNVISMFFGSANVEICRGLYLSAAIVTDLGNALDAVLSTIRVFALSGLNVWWASVVFVTSMFIVTTKFYLNAKTQYTVQNIDGIVMCNIFTYSGSVAAK
ncbi:hypothetical protein EVJ58_g7323 [Rhodofomes roseus]|uniref:DUF6533 domain-containing protein n=1 Tax=Rhodofomes roseus TaxID=34475 RepID=A0A4Y9Y3J9_9APHY|nr:hypothetical protein EVJ58_g7323 [Rhodofomes roseus]